ncbi:hypothetical protein DFJ74DRAFT_708081 [Hyaloraphidium curvatum]|nr:hypothetical protein DFJ74DRAFT_708081 [Hyaloraphidium curvatum]
MDGAPGPGVPPHGLKPLAVPRHKPRRSAGVAAQSATLHNPPPAEGDARRRSAEASRGAGAGSTSATHVRRSSHLAEPHVVQTSAARVSPTSPVAHRAGYTAAEEAYYPPASPAHAATPVSAADAAPHRPVSIFTRLQALVAGAGRVQPISPTSGPQSSTPSKPSALAKWPAVAVVSEDWSTGRASGVDWKDSAVAGPDKMDDEDDKASKPSSPSMIMLQQKQRCGSWSATRIWGLVILLLAVITVLVIVIVPTVVVVKQTQDAGLVAQEFDAPVEQYETYAVTSSSTSSTTSRTTSRTATPTKTRTRTTTATTTQTTTTTTRRLPDAWDPLPWTDPLGPANVVNRCVEPGMFALTFDDGPMDWTNILLDQLAQEGVTATFFINGRNFGDIRMQPYMSMVDRMTSEGHVVASHTWGHRTLRGLSEDDIRWQMNNLDNATFYQYGFRPRYMRPPSGRYDDSVRRVLGELGYRDMVLWTVDPEDWSTPQDPEGTFRRYAGIMQGFDPARDGIILLLHDVHESTARTLARRVVRHAKDNGWRFVTMDACLGQWGQAYRERPVKDYYAP